MMNRIRPWGWLFVLAVGMGFLPVLLWAWLSPWQAQPPVEGALSLVDQSALVLAVYGFKTLYMLLTIGLVVLIWSEKSPALMALKGFLVAFWLGEFFCWINILFYAEEALLFEYLHSLLMVFCLGFLGYSMIEALDEGLLHFSDPRTRCALVGVCKVCVKAAPGKCVLRQLFKWMLPLVGVVAFMPLMAQPFDYAIRTQVLGVQRTLTHLMPIQWYELRFSPLAALGLMAVAWLALVRRGHTSGGMRTSKILLSAAFGQLSFTFMRLIFAFFYRQGLVWFAFWEEFTELILVLGVVVVLWLFRSEQFARSWAAFRQMVS